MLSRPPSKSCHGDLETFSFLAEPVSHRHPHVLKNHCPGRLRVPAHFALVGAERNSRRVARNNESGNARWARAAGARHHHIEIAGSGTGDKLFLTIEDIKVAIACRTRHKRRSIRAGAWLGEAIARQKLHGAELRQPLASLRRRAEGVDHPGGHVVDRHIGGDRRTACRQRLEDQSRVEPGQPGTADIGSHVNSAHSQ